MKTNTQPPPSADAPSRILIVGANSEAVECVTTLFINGTYRTTGVRVMALRLLAVRDSRLLTAWYGKHRDEVGHRMLMRATIYSCLDGEEAGVRKILDRQGVALTSRLRVEAYRRSGNAGVSSLDSVAH